MVTLPAFFSDGMIIGKKARIWGSTTAGREVTLSFLQKTFSTVADAEGWFEFLVESPDYGGPHTMTIGDRVISDVYVGRLWLCGGQSNMEMPLGRVRQLLGGHMKEDTRIRAFTVAKDVKFDAPARQVQGKWHTATGDILQHLYAVPYFFARKLLDAMRDDVPIGLLNVAAGGTPIEGWLPEEIIKEYPDLYEKLETVRAAGYMADKQKEADDANREWHEELNHRDTVLKEERYMFDFDDNDEGNQNRALLDNSGLTHGSVWYRKKILLNEIPQGVVTLDLGRAVDSVTVYVNGTEVKAVDYQYPPCLCELPDGLLKQGENIIIIRLIGSGNKPRFIPGKDYALTFPDGRIDLNDGWQCRVGAEMPPSTGFPWFYGYPCCVYNFMLAPVLGVKVDGLIWYQGESNVGNPAVYKSLFTRFVQMLRSHCGEDLPVIFTQLADYLDDNCTAEVSEIWAQLREAQRQCLSIPDTAMAVAIDCGEEYDIHPLDKKTVGERLALHALKMVYKRDITADGPTATRAERKSGRIVIHFENAVGLWSKGGRPMVDIITQDDSIHRLYADINNQVLIINTNESAVKAVRFGWSDFPSVTLYNAYNLPASPFEMEVSP
jgi:sialate O-acetylesterase